jgi:uncharacterized protein (DUF2235 family)
MTPVSWSQLGQKEGAISMKRLVVCCDGTWNVPDQGDGGMLRPSNVVKMALVIKGEDDRGIEQRVYYHTGVGTGRSDHLFGGAFGIGLSHNILDAYRFLVDEYDPGDEIYLFGFSRGAYTARSIAGFIRNSGVLRREFFHKLGAAFRLYRRRDDASHPAAVEATLFRASYALEVRIRFIGVWDTVGSLGIPAGIPWLPASWLHVINRRWAFHDVTLSSYVDAAYHAIAIDEQRPQFVPTLWEQQDGAKQQTMEQRWFAGVHTNIGGGYRDSGLSDITLCWMKEKAESCGLAIDLLRLENMKPQEITVEENVFGQIRDSRTGLYRLFPSNVRAIGQGKKTNEAVHDSAREREEGDLIPPYKPGNLMRYLKAGGEVVTS